MNFATEILRSAEERRLQMERTAVPAQLPQQSLASKEPTPATAISSPSSPPVAPKPKSEQLLPQIPLLRSVKPKAAPATATRKPPSVIVPNKHAPKANMPLIKLNEKKRDLRSIEEIMLDIQSRRHPVTATAANPTNQPPSRKPDSRLLGSLPMCAALAEKHRISKIAASQQRKTTTLQTPSKTPDSPSPSKKSLSVASSGGTVAASADRENPIDPFERHEKAAKRLNLQQTEDYYAQNYSSIIGEMFGSRSKKRPTPTDFDSLFGGDADECMESSVDQIEHEEKISKKIAIAEDALGILSTLSSSDPKIRQIALNQLLEGVDFYWPEIADALPTLEAMQEKEGSSLKNQVLLLMAKVYFFLNMHDEALSYALQSGSILEKHDQGLFSRTLLGKAIDLYSSQWQSCEKSQEPLGALVERVFYYTLREQADYPNSLGLAIEIRRDDLFFTAISEAPRDQWIDLISFSLTLLQQQFFTATREVRDLFLAKIEDILKSSVPLNFLVLAKVLIERSSVAQLLELLEKLLSQPETAPIAYQIAFDCQDSFLLKEKLLLELRKSAIVKPLVPIVEGVVSSSVYREFLSRHNSTDQQILEGSRSALGTASTHLLSAVAFANGLQHAGTMCDEFFRRNVEYFKHATNWAKFNHVASIGMIHLFNAENAQTILQNYLPTANSTGSPFFEGGALFALGLISGSQSGAASESTIGDLVNALHSFQKDPIIHGACLGLGAAAMASQRDDLSEALFTVLYGDNALTGEAAAIAIGLIRLGSCDRAVYGDLLAYAHETQHEKIKRGIAIGIGLVFLGAKDSATDVIKELLADDDFLLRIAGVNVVGMAYAVSDGCDLILQQLLHIAVSDESDDVRRAAATSIGFVTALSPEKCPPLVSLLSQSYNPHIRYGCAMALGISCAGTGSEDAALLLDALAKDKVDFVKQSALIAQSMLFMQCNERSHPRSAALRGDLQKIISSKYEETLVRFGATIAQGILDAAGRNAFISLVSEFPSDQPRAQGVVGVFLFSYFWNWYPAIPFLSLALKPTAFVAITADTLGLPDISVACAAASNLFTYPPPIKVDEGVTQPKVSVAVLSTTHKMQTRSKNPSSDAMAIDPVPPAASEKERQPPSVDANPHQVFNLTRVLPRQVQFMQLSSNSSPRFGFVCDTFRMGILVAKDQTPNAPLVTVFDINKEQPNAAPLSRLPESEDVPAPEPFDLMAE